MRIDERLSALAMPAIDRLGGHDYREKSRVLAAAERLDPEQLAALQLERVSALIAYCYERVPYYRSLFDDLGATPADIRSLKDFASLPMLDRQALRSEFESLRADGVADAQITRVVTAGSTGAPAAVLHDREYVDWGWAAFMRNERWAGLRCGERELWFTRPSPQSAKRRLALALRRWRVVGVNDISPERIAAWADELRSFRPRFVYGYPSAIEALSRHLLADDRKVTGVNAVMTTSERLLDEQRAIIADAFGARVYSQYGSTECYSLASECEAGNMHVNSDVNVVEFAHTSAKGAEGDVGEVVVTPLFSQAMPLLRYRLGDLAEAVPGPCPCGRPFPLMRIDTGRIADVLVFRGDHQITSLVFERVARAIPCIERFQFRQTGPESVDLLVITRQPDSAELLAGLAGVEAAFERETGFHIDITTRFVDELPLTVSGKHRYAIPLAAD